MLMWEQEEKSLCASRGRSINEISIFRMMIDRRTCRFGVCITYIRYKMEWWSSVCAMAHRVTLRLFIWKSIGPQPFYKSMRSDKLAHCMTGCLVNGEEQWNSKTRHWTHTIRTNTTKLQINISEKRETVARCTHCRAHRRVLPKMEWEFRILSLLSQ